MGVNWKKVLQGVHEALEFFKSEGAKPTLRTLFYRLYSMGLIGNTKSQYKQLSKHLVDARKAGRLPWDFYEDKERRVTGELDDYRFSDDVVDRLEEKLDDKLEELDFNATIDEFFDYLSPGLHVGKWAEQPSICEIWIEKEAMVSMIQAWTGSLEVPIRANRGYSSWTFIYTNVGALKSYLETHSRVFILYLGDLDPSGVDMERFLGEALEYFGIDPQKVVLGRLALTQQQVEAYKLPPRPEDAETLAKLERDPRTKGYRIPYVTELDAFLAYAPGDFRRLVQSAVRKVWDESRYRALSTKAVELREQTDRMIDDIKDKARKKVLDQIRSGEGVD